RYDLAIPLNNIPVLDNLKFSGMIWIEECPTRSRAILGVDFSFWPCMMEASGARSFVWGTKYPGWTEIYADIPDRAKALARKLFPYQFWAVEPATGPCTGPCNVSVYVPRIFLQLFTRDTGAVDRRMVVYVDDLRIEGEVPDKEEFKKYAEKKWAKFAEKTNKKIDEWEKILISAERELAGLTRLSGEAEKLKTELEKKLKENDVRTMPAVKEAREKGWLTAATYEKLEAFYNNLKNRYLTNIRHLSRSETTRQVNRQKCIIYAVDTTITPADWVLPDMVLVPGKITGQLSLRACRGEYEPVSFVVRALADIKNLEIRPAALSGPAGKISPEAMDIKVVKCWYQDALSEGGRALMPELLLNDENLIQVDHQKKLSRIKFNLPQGPKYLCLDDPEWPKPVLRSAPLPEDYPVWVANDSETLKPVQIPARTNKQFWVTVKVPEDAKPGRYSGKISLESDNRLLGEITLRLEVLPITLSAPYCSTSVFSSYSDLGVPSLYNQGKLYPSGYELIERRYRSELKDQVAHGISVPLAGLDDGAGRDFLGPVFHKEMLERTLRIRNELAPQADKIFFGATHVVHRGLGIFSHKGLTRMEISPETREKFLKELAEYIEIARSYGMKEVYFHLADERDGKELEAWLPVFEIVHQAGAKFTNSMQIGSQGFELVGGITDVFLCENGINKKEVEKWHSKGTRVWPTWNPTGGREDSDLSRRNHGLLLWKTGCDGVVEVWYSLDSGWMEAASGKTGLGGDGQQNLVYRTVDGIIDTIQWEGYREGIDDLRYVTTLEKLIARVKKTGEKKKEAAEAEKYLENIDVEYGNLDEIRTGIIQHILKLK
ncbi:MAG TPA: hypothetical protein PKX93_08000, partial [bacterium]|nr:hypothetical protein [bacterium]